MRRERYRTGAAPFLRSYPVRLSPIEWDYIFKIMDKRGHMRFKLDEVSV